MLRGTFNAVIKYRYIIGLTLFVVLVLFKYNGSSIDAWNLIVPSNSSSVALGHARPVRGDEWCVQTPYDLAQGKSSTPYSVTNSNISASGQNMIVSYNSPVWDVSVLSKPMNWGFLLFGGEYGLSWYWCMKLILLVLLSYELCTILTRGNRFVSAFGALWIAFSPAVQWWFMQHVCDIVFYLEALIVTFYYFFKYFDSIKLKITFAVLFSLSAVGYALTLYPAIQIPLAYLALLMMIMIFLGFRKQVSFKRLDVIIVCGAAVLSLVIIAHVLFICKDAIKATLNTAYPGKRVSVGGQAVSYSIYNFLTNPFLPFKDSAIPNTNNCEFSAFYNFLPAVLLSFPLLIKKKAKNLPLGIGLAVFSLLSICYMYFKIPVIIAKITLLSYVTYRIAIAYGLSSVFLSIWAVSELSEIGVSDVKYRIYSAAASLAIAFSYFYTIENSCLKQYVSLKYYLVLIFILMLLCFLLMCGMKKAFCAVILPLIVISSATINPVNFGVGGIYSSQVSGLIRTIGKQNPKANWISTDDYSLGAYLYANGVRTLDGINYYPDLNKWYAIDPQHKNERCYNRYAHICFHITEGATSFYNKTSDTLLVTLNVNDLKKLNVNYIMSRKDNLESYDTGEVTIKKVYPSPTNTYYIYSVAYS